MLKKLNKLIFIQLFFILFFAMFFVNSANAAYKKISKQQQQDFINKINAAVVNQNKVIMKTRSILLEEYESWGVGKPLPEGEITWVDNLAQEYDVDDEKNNELTVQEWEILLRRVDIIPPSLAVAQAINESAWGRSRFAKEANNYYGQWCYSKGCGLEPLERDKGSRYEVRKFSSFEASVISYMKNLNTHYTYKDFRIERAKLRSEGKNITGLGLLPYLQGYSQVGSKYNKYIQSIITSSDLQDLDLSQNSNPAIPA